MLLQRYIIFKHKPNFFLIENFCFLFFERKFRKFREFQRGNITTYSV